MRKTLYEFSNFDKWISREIFLTKIYYCTTEYVIKNNMWQLKWYKICAKMNLLNINIIDLNVMNNNLVVTLNYVN